MGDAINQDWANDPRVKILHLLDDPGQPYSCDTWGNAGLNGVPIIAGGLLDSGNDTFFKMFKHPGNDKTSRPLVVLINHEMEISYIYDVHVSQIDVHDLITLMLNDFPPLSIETNRTPEEFYIHKLYPNPFNPVLHINFDLSLSGLAQIDILDITGAHIETLYSGFLNSGSHNLNWQVEFVPSGIYLLSLKFGEKSLTEKVVLLK